MTENPPLPADDAWTIPLHGIPVPLPPTADGPTAVPPGDDPPTLDFPADDVPSDEGYHPRLRRSA